MNDIDKGQNKLPTENTEKWANLFMGNRLVAKRMDLSFIAPAIKKMVK